MAVENLYFRWIPDRSVAAYASHNLTLSLYLKLGYFYIAILLYFFYQIFYLLLNSNSKMVMLSGIVFVVAHSITVETLFFYPSAVLWLALIFYVARKAGSGLALEAIPR